MITTDGHFKPLELSIVSLEQPEYIRNVCTGKGPTLDCELLNQPDLGPNADVWLYGIKVYDPSTPSAGLQDLCPGGGPAIPIAGAWEEGIGHAGPQFICDASGQNCELQPGHNGGGKIPGTDNTAFVFACYEVGALAKCIVNDEYKPWKTSTAHDLQGNALTVSREDAFEACVRMIRADYCGDGQPHTQNGTAIDVSDGIGLESPEIGTYGFEAEWTPSGASCIAQTRFSGPDPLLKNMTVAQYINDNCKNAWNNPILVGNSCGSPTDFLYSPTIQRNPDGSRSPGRAMPNAYTMNWSSTLTKQ
jgi:hypothetical protein